MSVEPIRIEDPDDPRVADFLSIRERDHVRVDSFIAEGRTVLDQLLVSPFFEADSLFILESRLDGLAERLARVPSTVPVYTASRNVMSQVAGFPIHRGVLAHGRRRREPRGLRPEPAGRIGGIGLIGLSDADNLGAIFRNARAFGVPRVLLDETCVSPLYRKAIRVSVGASLTVPWSRSRDAGAILETCEREGCRPIALAPAGDRTLQAALSTGDPRPLVPLFGAEGGGLDAQILARCETVRIAMADGFDSLNVAATSAIVLHALFEASGPA